MNRVAYLVGFILIGAGVASLFYMWKMLEIFFNDPTQLKLLQYFKDTINLSEQTIRGTMDGKEFTMTLPEGLLTVGLFIIAIMVMGLAIGLINAFIANGISLVRLAAKIEDKERRSGSET